VGDVVLVASDEQLMCLDAERKLRWSLKLEQGGLSGPPVQDGDHLLIACRRGVVLQVHSGSGEVTGSQNVGEPLVSGVVPGGEQLLVATCSGSVFLVARPQPEGGR
jgi:hypothetical protein